MAVDAPLLTRQRLVAFKAETTTGSAESLTTAEATTNIFDPSYRLDIPYVDRRGQSALSRLKGVPGARKATLAMSLHAYGKGSSGVPAWGTLLQACGMSLSGSTYSFSTGSSSAVSVTAALYQDGRFKSLVGGMGNLVMTGNAGEPVVCAFSIDGVPVAPTPVAILAPTYDTVIPPRFAGGTFTIGGTAYKIKSFELDFGNVIAMRPTPATAAGNFAAYITDRMPKIKVDPEALALGTKDWYADHLASTTAAISIVIGSAANNTITLSIPVAQLMNPPQDGDRDGVLTDELEFLCVRNAAAGDDELTVSFS